MAVIESKSRNTLCDESSKSSGPPVVSYRETECYRFKLVDLLYYVFSVSFFFADVATDSIMFVEYFLQGHLSWGCFTMSLTILPSCIIQLFSLRWHYSDGSLKSIHWILHFMFLGVLHRYLVLLYTAIHSLRTKQFIKDKNWVYRQESDICMLHLFESFMGAAPQLILQLYVMAMLHHAPLWTGISAVVAFCSLTWAVGTYTKAMHKMNCRNNTSWIALTLQALWRGGMLTSRIALLVLTAVCLRKWFLLFLGLHWFFMTIWVVLQNTDFCPTVWEERVYNCIIGLIYCFDFFNLRTGRSRYRILTFYMIVVIQNLIFLIVYMLYFKDTKRTEVLIIAPVIVVGGMLIGLASMMLYYGKYHPSKFADKSGNKDSEVVVPNKADTPRSIKQYYRGSLVSLPHSVDTQRTASEKITTDKQFLLTNIVQISDSVEEGVTNRTYKSETEIETAVSIISERKSPCNHPKEEENLAGQTTAHSKLKLPAVHDGSREYLEVSDKSDAEMESVQRQKRRGICLTHRSDIDTDIAEVDSNTCSLPSQKRRGICSSTQLIPDVETIEVETITSDLQKWKHSPTIGIGLNLAELEGGVSNKISATLNDIKSEERSKASAFDAEKLSEMDKLSKDETMQQKDETMSCVTSIHDYENVCPLGIARPPWCIRSWKGYTDIETYIHDDSVVRDRRRDTLTSTTTGTTYSSEYSDTTSSLLRSILKQDDYLDTLTYDLVEPREQKSANEDTFARNSGKEEQNATVYIAKPIVIDEKGGMFALDTILEERDDSLPPVDDKFEQIESPSNSVSTLVNTIDQIRKYAAENSPRHIYHSTDSHWEDSVPKDFTKKSFTKTLFENDLDTASVYDNRVYASNESALVVKGKCEIDAIRELVKCCAIESIRKTPLISAILSDSPILGNKAKPRKRVTISENKLDSSDNDLYIEMNSLVPAKDSVHKNVETKCDDSVNSSTSINEQSLDVCSSNARKAESSCEKRKRVISYPKRKFSLLKERFEPKSQRLVYVVTPNNTTLNPNLSRSSVSVIPKKPPDLCNKENLAPVPSKISPPDLTSKMSCVNADSNQKLHETEKSLCNVQYSLKERRHVFLEQVLSSPKLLTWNKKK